MASCSFNDIGNFLSTHNTPGDSALFAVDLPSDDVFVKEKIFRKDGDRFVFAPTGLEAFIARRFSCRDYFYTGNVCCFGTVQGRELHYSADPKPNFYNMHGAEASIIIGSNDADVPKDWEGRAALLSGVFTVRDEKIANVPTGIRRIFPSEGTHGKAKGCRKPHARRTFWLEYFCDFITSQQDKYGVIKTSERRGRDFSLEAYPAKFARPSPAQVLEWMRDNTGVVIKSDRTIRRDLQAFESFDPKKDAFDKRDSLIAAIWKHLTDPKFVLSEKTLEAITGEMAKIDAPEISSDSIVAKSAFEDDADKHGRNATRTVACAPALDEDMDLRTL